MDFSKIREMRKQNKRDPSRASLGNEEELLSSNKSATNIAQSVHHDYHQNHSPTREEESSATLIVASRHDC
ncbi:hypothetical protein CASFOL_018666 [Castilleja foliolosa]|uniref:Uncharacterized protein n=1 Tax=Castilleja foliolosa TaxID=1961234 RepID=A0ABD3D5C8_9LAMI